jgi:hypothetical protein
MGYVTKKLWKFGTIEIIFSRSADYYNDLDMTLNGLYVIEAIMP